MATEPSLPQDTPHLEEITKEIYKRNLELAIVNKTLSLLRKLYQISLLTLDPAALSEKISETVRVDLNMELVGVFLLDQKTDSLKPLGFSKSARLMEAVSELGFSLSKQELVKVSENVLLRQVVLDKHGVTTNNLHDIWSDPSLAGKLVTLSKASHIKTSIMHPLITQDKVIGALLFGLNRDYELLSEHEKDSINSLINVVAVAMDKAQLYEKLQETNEQLKILDQARSEFITIASHQLRTPPATIKWYLAAILSGDYGEVPMDVAVQLKKAEWTNNSLIALIDDLLNVSRIERGKMDFMFVPTDMLAITQTTFEQLQPQAEMRKLKLVFNKPDREIPKVNADKEKLRQVINNFIDNAIKYTKAGQITVDLLHDAENITLKVTDTGKGVRPDQVEHLFQKFDRAKQEVKNSTGMGLGLYVAKVIIEEHKGKIWVESPGEGKGSTFAFSIPIKSDLTTATFDLTKNRM